MVSSMTPATAAEATSALRLAGVRGLVVVSFRVPQAAAARATAKPTVITMTPGNMRAVCRMLEARPRDLPQCRHWDHWVWRAWGRPALLPCGREGDSGLGRVRVFALCMVGTVASYFWSGDYLWWPFLFSVIGVAVMLPVLLAPSIRAIVAAFKN
jgi:hypothetical protein